MDSSHLDQEDGSSPETFSDSSVSPDSSETSEIFGEPVVHPRVGDEYQVEIPPILGESEVLRLMINPADPEGVIDSSHCFTMGLSVPVMWVCNQGNLINDQMVDSLKIPLRSKSTAINSEKKEPNGQSDAPNQTSMSNGYSLVPGLSTDSWSDFEVDCFLLGLYMFGKNLLLVKRFMDGKEMGQILSFYYGRFYGSAGYCRWSECRKMRNRKCVLGHRFFTGYRQQELFSRLHPRLSEESKTKLLEEARAFAEGRTSLYDYVSTLKDLVGIQALVEAVAIGKGKEDLTTLFLDSSKNSQMFSNRPEIPSGKACSSLTCAEIVQYLTGDFRLSKARSNDLFWEAVWPRLLARGWHSEQPRGDGYTGSKNCLVFLMPGIKKFSRRKLAKGEHYFDSVSDVLAKVASEPELLVLEADETRPTSSKGENGWAVEVNSDDDDDDDQDSSDHERHCYLKPRVSAGLSNLMKFTVVDTSLANEDNPYRVRELRSLPLEAKRLPTLPCFLRKTETSMEEAKADVLPNGVHNSTFSDHVSGSQRIQGNDLDPPKLLVDVSLPTDHKSRAIKHQFSRRVKPGLSNCSGQVMKRRRLASCGEAEVTCVLSLPAGKNAAFRGMSKTVMPPKMSLAQVKVLQTDSSISGIPTENVLGKSLVMDAVDSHLKENKPEAPKAIDLNLPQVPTEVLDNDGKAKGEERENAANQHFFDAEKPKIKVEEEESSTSPHFDPYFGAYVSKKEEAGPTAVAPPSRDGGLDQQPRRQSTRSRPLTTKALEALEIGFLHPVRHTRKRSSSANMQDQKSKRARQPRSKSTMLSSVAGFEERPGDDITCNGKNDTPGNPHIEEASCKLIGLSQPSCTSEAP